MGDPDEPSLRSVKSKAAAALGLGRNTDKQPTLPTHNPQPTQSGLNGADPPRVASISNSGDLNEKSASGSNVSHKRNRNHGIDNTTAEGEASSAIGSEKLPLWSPVRIKAGSLRFLTHTKNAITHSWINLLLVFVPLGIAVKAAGLKPEIVFSMNAIAIIPLAGLLAHATEVVAARVGDALGALLNVSFGNAVELILFIILLSSNQIEVVQASLLGSILANLLLILGMAFLLGGLKYQEQVYNNTVTQMSGVMLALAVMSLLLPTAFHAAFDDNTIADHETLSVSRGTSVILLIVYGLYLLFQLKSHRYLYASTPQHIIDEESHPGVLAGAFDSSSSTSSSSSSDDSDSSSNSSNGTMKRKAKRMVKRLRRKSSASSKDGATLSAVSSPSAQLHESPFETERNTSVVTTTNGPAVVSRRHSIDVMSGDEADNDQYAPVIRDFEAASHVSNPSGKPEKRTHKRKEKKHRRDRNHEMAIQEKESEPAEPKVTFAEQVEQNTITPTTSRRQYRPALPSLLSTNVFTNPQNPTPTGPAPNIRMAAPRAPPLRRARSLPERMDRESSQSNTSNRPAVSPQAAMALNDNDEDDDAPDMSIKAAIFMLLFSTALVAVCADFMSGAIDPMVKTSGISQAFIGLIILPIVGNAAEHVTAVTVAMKNKMDLAIGIAVGSSIQIAIFITPVIVVLGWIMGKPMTLYFNIFETVALFVTVLVVNFLVLDGRSNYLEGSLLIAAYVIIALSSFFYPDGCEASAIGGNEQRCGAGGTVSATAVHMMLKRMVAM
ncbi:vacuolar calcium ion transporter /H(+) exchanger [Cucurbitaria berberidis CBS 394.84]|uniref:Vacuolar calcium ion transporter /H(+) exchanger n=1 Tax=Cucurbitaria berberidis CBS 394.84 TaxID=1168544 RepID=A0A9P4GCY1_9PLEO|nr:vacuolar calcium ion transporter /H(+) exchanger [Cucurbitaria berberidis CBS 394.84]KAF1843209.1 vacuolar calcium ion transporter /H(+) exchanger [Cucurbitaria berberidis CBS 394.84]